MASKEAKDAKDTKEANLIAIESFNRQVEASKAELLAKRIEELQAENENLRFLHAKGEKEIHEFVAYFQRELGTREKIAAKLTEELNETKQRHTDDVEAWHSKYDSETKQLKETNRSLESSLSSKLKIAQEDLSKLEVFRDMRETLEKKLNAVTDALESERVAHKDAVSVLERKFLEEKARAQKDTEKRIEKIKQQSREDARNILDADTRKIVTDNKRMGDELRFQLQMTDELQREKDKLVEQTKALQRELQLHDEKEQEYAKYGQRQTREIKQLQAKVKTLEKSLSQVVSTFEKEKHALTIKTEKSLDADGLRKLLKLKNKELRTMKRLAQTILDQRTDVEQFFLDSLDIVKEQLVDERRKAIEVEKRQDAKLTAAERGLKFPRLKHAPPATTSNNASFGCKEKVDLRALTWEERERVLRLLFGKINSMQGFFEGTAAVEDDALQTPFITEATASVGGPVMPRFVPAFPSRPPTTNL
ncbi:hypothetical protein SPRG_07754 [Saprolegnia parasitica CBS 223.65]|uniref:DUF4515 domain-containing protein n=1 Tax=Saprolegnia parasitica (strain CBS 223.65) TaxID=695850 RepID=A0A067C952_SAPPC|nr:hypothetical protein SPRG_07754 [Saprolegnia parasitica CBS 223.65]KDO27043.1 hypothetical protein SPRG_07754 [Saprolegnia parasitica CBS 223.65]|eukprot:XP_012202138.1 hypothetical protein SPRG_07754 [Saprolegnia parasitica CBS 223.65]